jgi:SNF2 family DNA or RNA helicase
MMAASRKRKAVLAMVGDHTQSGQKVVVFTGRRRDCDTMGEDLRAHLPKVTVWAAHGETSPEDRQVIVDEYMAHPGPCVLVGTGQAWGESLNLQSTDAAFFVMLPFTPGMLRQWEGRFARLGQDRPVIIYYVIAEGTVDEHIAAILIDKLPAVALVAEDTELAEAHDVLAGLDEDDETFVDSVLACLDI